MIIVYVLLAMGIALSAGYAMTGILDDWVDGLNGYVALFLVFLVCGISSTGISLLLELALT